MQANDVRTGVGANQDRTAGASLDHQGAQIFGRNEKRFHVIDSVGVDERWLAGQLSHFGNEFTRSLLQDRGAVPQRIASGDSH